MAQLLSGPTNSGPRRCAHRCAAVLGTYRRCLRYRRPARDALLTRWGDAKDDPFCRDGVFRLPVRLYGHVAIGIQPARGYNIDPKSTYHDPSLCRRTAISLSISGSARSFGAHAVDSQSASTAISNGCPARPRPCRRVLSGASCSAAAAALSVHRQRSGRRHPGQAADRRGHHRSSHSAADPRRNLRAVARSRNADRRICALPAAWMAAAAVAALRARDLVESARPSPRCSPPTSGTRTKDSSPRCLSVRPQGEPDPRRPPCFRHEPPEAASRPICWSLSRACRAARDGRRPRCCARSLMISASHFDPSPATMAITGKGPTDQRSPSYRSLAPVGDTVERLEALARRMVSRKLPNRPGPASSARWIGSKR